MVVIVVACLTGARRPAVRAFLDVDPEGLEQPAGAGSDVVDRALERLLVALRGRAVSAHLPDELPRGRFDFAGRRGRLGPAESLDASAHVDTVALASITRRRGARSGSDGRRSRGRSGP